jgi:predicted RNA-binding Zn-ribbon protein involved in translation (DUF1610 family)
MRGNTEGHEQDIITRYVVHHERAQTIADKYHVTRQGIYKTLQRNGIDTAKSQRVLRICPTCGSEVLVRRGRARKHDKSFCSDDCYMAYLEALGDGYIESNYHCREARKIVSQYFCLQDGHIVHHEDKNQTHNGTWNLRVFAGQGDHIRYHRGFKVEALWNGLLVDVG